MKYKMSVMDVIKFEIRSFLFRFVGLDRPKLFPEPNFLNLGCGPNYINGMVNADFFGAFRFWRKQRKLEWHLDLRYPLNCDDSIFDGVFTEHTLEHLYIDEAEELLKELYRIMKVGAVIRLTVPDLKKYVAYYTENVCDEEMDTFKEKFHTGASAFRNLTQNYFHRSVWDFDELRHYLDGVGFREITQKQYRECSNPRLCLDLDHRAWETLYVEARKVSD